MEQESSRLAQLRQELENAHREEAELAAKLRHIHEAREALRAAPPPPAPTLKPQPAEPIFLFLAWCLLGLRRFPFLSQSSCQVLRFTLPCLPCEW